MKWKKFIIAFIIAFVFLFVFGFLWYGMLMHGAHQQVATLFRAEPRYHALILGHIVMAFLYTAIAGGLLAVAVAARRRRLQETVDRTAAFVRTGGSNVGEIEHGAANNRFAYAPAIAIGALAALLVH